MHKLLNKNLNALLVKRKLTSQELSEAIHVPLPTINRLRSDSKVNPTIGTLIPICQYFNVTLNQILGFEPLLIEDNNNVEITPKLNTIPLLNWHDVPKFKNNRKPKMHTTIYTELSNNLALYALKVETSNWGTFAKDSIIMISTNTAASHGDYVVVYSVKDHLIGIKQFITDIDGIYLKSLNDSLQTIKLTDQYKISGVIIQTRNNLKHI